MADSTIQIQNQIRNNAHSIREYLDDLGNWEQEIKQKDLAFSKKKPPTRQTQPVRSSVQTSKPKPVINEVYKRDYTNMKEYYKAWDKFNVDQQLDKLQEEQKPKEFKPPSQPIKPRTKINVIGGKSENNKVDRLKDQGNICFKGHNYEGALQNYQEALKISRDQEISTILQSNSAECYLRLRNYIQAVKSADQALKIQPFHVKSLVRRAKAHQALMKFSLALADIDQARKIQPNNQELVRLFQGYTNKKNRKTREILQKMTSIQPVRHQVYSVAVQEVNGEGPMVVQEEKTLPVDEIARKAVNSLDISSLPFPKALTEMERNWISFESSDKLESYVEFLLQGDVQSLFARSSIESDFFMRIISTFETFGDPIVAHIFLVALFKVKNLKLLLKFLTKREVQKIKSLLDRVGREGIDVQGL